MPDRDPPTPLAATLGAALLVSVLVLAEPASAQTGHEGHAGHGALGADTSAVTAASPYTDLVDREIKALSADDVAGLRAGAGMSMALPAELNGWPGPRHVLELADALELSEEQRVRVAEIRDAMAAEATALGERVIGAEATLDGLFANGAATVAGVEEAAAEVGRLRGALRASHLVAHLATREALTPEQVAAYVRLRGYGDGG